MKPILFLDIDGVLIPYPRNDHPMLHPRPDMKNFNPYCVGWLSRLLHILDAEIVVTGAMRIGMTIPEMRELFARQGVYGTVVGATGSRLCRHDEIRDWMESNTPSGRCRHLILDDEWESIDPPVELVMVHDRHVGLDAGTFNSAVTRWMVLEGRS